MTRNQFRWFNSICLFLGTLLLVNFALAQVNERLELTVNQYQAYINQARQSETLLDQVAKRIARGSDTAPELKGILQKRQLNVTLEVNGQTKQYP